MPYLFVYGTLKSGCGNHRYLKNAQFLGEAEVEGYTLIGVIIPYAVEAPGCKVKGELYRVSQEELEAIDQLEIPAGYARVEVEARTPWGAYKAWMYAYPERRGRCARESYNCE
ncbi:gamma-glutamylcyclotransferase family protein [Pyrobaculum aerophilum]|uniref:Gamma-glutamylcyclotransferase AIG2-like domain-containing protein n=2 Tax=Pyrobaculum aerophilum TaxID=13773 RepID=Q8ZZP7_PYRAE|nr:MULTISPECIES: gamma-glutamylcyclotransferase [Pyrobaculum]AAL62592.1 conserved hypothetical protein [Pyrobaculum aerophilum str. IM2]MCX8137019.1 gamma-glutamylcyclotransferase [Pyrobaculum aerophilum]HII46651.1 gamma-glutamylcyclotransferase [Pyrobaculum aerophilum]